ncbi:MAG: hypothetical protein NT007_10840 [Candidatus Kapabacteria bacterium]|nr:hypothetical protein [Candidatus Kapabacteria bacterium]
MNLTAALAAITLNLLIFSISLVYLKRIGKSDWEIFIKRLFTSVALRFIIVLATFYICIVFFNFPKLAFALTFFITYIIFLGMEVLILNSFSNKASFRRK